MADPNRPAKPESIARSTRKQQEKNFQYSDGSARVNNLPPKESKTGINGAMSEEDRLRLKLRDVRRKVRNAEGDDLPTQIVTLPGVCGLSFATRYIDGGRDRFIECVQLAVLERQPNAEMWWRVFADLTAYERSIVSFDDVCAAAGVRPSRLMAEVISIMMELGRDAGNLIAALTHAKVMGRMAESAERIDGPHADLAIKDRHAFLQGMQFLPTPKGTTIHVSASANAKAAAAAASEPSVPSFTQTLQQAADARRALPAASASDLPFAAGPVPDPVEAELIGRDEE